MSITASFNIISPPARAAHSLRRRLWQAAIVFGGLVLVLIACDVHTRLCDPSPKLALGHDLLPSYAAGELVRQGQARLMYDRAAVSAVEFRVIREANLDIDNRYGPWLNPPFFAWFFAPLSALPYRQAAAAFLIFNLLLVFASLALLTRMVADPRAEGSIRRIKADWQTLALVPILVILPLPFWQAMGHQQNTFISFFLLILSVTFWRHDKPLIAGLIAGLLFFKPQLAVLFAAALVIGTGWRALAGLAVTGLTLLAITLWTLPGCLVDFLHRLPPILHWLQLESPYNWGRQVTLQSFWRLALQGHVRGETLAAAKVLWWFSSAAFFVTIAAAAWRFRRRHRDKMSRDRLIAASIVSMPMLMPYYMDYDLLLMAVPAVLLAAEWMRRPDRATRADYWLLAAWTALAIESHLNPGLAGHSRLNLAVPLLSLISALHLWRCLRGDEMIFHETRKTILLELFPTTSP